MPKRYPVALLLPVLTATLLGGGCASKTAAQNGENPALQKTMSDNPVGSRIRREQKRGPTQEIAAEDLDQVNQRTTTETIKALQAGRN